MATTIELLRLLLRQWQVLWDWLMRTRRAPDTGRLRQAAQDWEAKGRSSVWLGYSAAVSRRRELAQREDFLRFITPVDSAYLEACRAQENKAELELKRPNDHRRAIKQ